MERQISVMVADNDETYAKNLTNYIKTQKDLIPAGYATDGEAALDMAVIARPDAIVMELLMPGLDGIGFLRRLRGLNIVKKPIILINSRASLPNAINSAIGYGANYFMVKPQPYSEICDRIRDFASETTAETVREIKEYDSLERHVTELLHQLGIPAHLIGYKYMRSAIIHSVNDMNLLNPITKRLYPLIAEEYNTTKSCVERAIRHAIAVSWKRGSKRVIAEIFGYSREDNASRVPTNSEYIAMAADDLRLREKYAMLA